MGHFVNKGKHLRKVIKKYVRTYCKRKKKKCGERYNKNIIFIVHGRENESDPIRLIFFVAVAVESQ